MFNTFTPFSVYRKNSKENSNCGFHSGGVTGHHHLQQMTVRTTKICPFIRELRHSGEFFFFLLNSWFNIVFLFCRSNYDWRHSCSVRQNNQINNANNASFYRGVAVRQPTIRHSPSAGTNGVQTELYVFPNKNIANAKHITTNELDL